MNVDQTTVRILLCALVPTAAAVIVAAWWTRPYIQAARERRRQREAELAPLRYMVNETAAKRGLDLNRRNAAGLSTSRRAALVVGGVVLALAGLVSGATVAVVLGAALCLVAAVLA